MRSMSHAIPTGLVLAIGEKKSNQAERPGCRRPGGSVNDVPKAHGLQLGPGRDMRMILMDLMGSRHRPLRGRRIYSRKLQIQLQFNWRKRESSGGPRGEFETLAREKSALANERDDL